MLLKGKDYVVEAERSGIESDEKRARKRHTQFLVANGDIVHIRHSG